jgi:hypothetical protein
VKKPSRLFPRFVRKNPPPFFRGISPSGKARGRPVSGELSEGLFLLSGSFFTLHRRLSYSSHRSFKFDEETKSPRRSPIYDFGKKFFTGYKELLFPRITRRDSNQLSSPVFPRPASKFQILNISKFEFSEHKKVKTTNGEAAKRQKNEVSKRRNGE